MKVYTVIKFGGEYEDKWEVIDSVYASRESAEKRVKEIEGGLTASITYEEWDRLVEEVDYYEYEQEEYFDNLIDGILFLHPEWVGTEVEANLKEAELAYHQNEDTYGALIAETEFYNE